MHSQNTTAEIRYGMLVIKDKIYTNRVALELGKRDRALFSSESESPSERRVPKKFKDGKYCTCAQFLTYSLRTYVPTFT